MKNMWFKPIDFKNEIWLPITNSIVPNVRENKYIASNTGFVSNIDYYKHHMVYTIRYYGHALNRAYVFLDCDRGSRPFSLPRIIAKLFCPGYQLGLDVNHKDGNTRHNYDSNLEWVTKSENIRHAYDNGLIQSLVTSEMVHDICYFLQEDKLSALEIAEISGLIEISSNPIALISAIKKGKLWTHISCNYIFPSSRHDRLFSDEQTHIICKMLEVDNNVSEYEILNTLGIIPKNKEDYKRYQKVIYAIRSRRKYTNISSLYSF